MCLDFSAGSGARSLGGLCASGFGSGGGAATASRGRLFRVFGDLFFDAGGSFGNSFDIAGEFMDSEDEAEGVSAMVELIGFLERFNGGFNLAEFFLCFRESDIAGRKAVLELDSLLEGHGGFFVGAGFEINQANVMEGGRVVVEGLGDFETFDGFVELLFLRIEDAKTVVGGGVFFVEFQDSEKGFFGAERLMVAHRSLGGAPEFFHLHVVAGGFRGFGGFATENRIQKDNVNR